MASVSVNMSVPTLELKSPSEQRRIIRQFLKRRTAVLGLIIITLELLIIGLGPYFVGYEPEKAVMVDRFLPPNELHLMGTDDLGRDIFARVISGGRLSLGIGLFSVSLGMLIGVPLG